MLLKIRPFRKGFDEETFVRILNAAFSDYDDIRSMTLEEMKKMLEAPSFNTDGLFIAEWKARALKAQEMEDVLLYVDEMNPTEAQKLYEQLRFVVAKKNIIYRKLLTQQTCPSHV